MEIADAMKIFDEFLGEYNQLTGYTIGRKLADADVDPNIGVFCLNKPDGTESDIVVKIATEGGSKGKYPINESVIAKAIIDYQGLAGPVDTNLVRFSLQPSIKVIGKWQYSFIPMSKYDSINIEYFEEKETRAKCIAVAQLGKDIANALYHLNCAIKPINNDNETVHRDIKLNNILCYKNKDYANGIQFILADFDTVKYRESSGKTSIGNNSLHQYPSELYTAGGNISGGGESKFKTSDEHQRDIYALGSVMYQCLWGKKGQEKDKLGRYNFDVWLSESDRTYFTDVYEGNFPQSDDFPAEKLYRIIRKALCPMLHTDFAVYADKNIFIDQLEPYKSIDDFLFEISECYYEMINNQVNYSALFDRVIELEKEPLAREYLESAKTDYNFVINYAYTNEKIFAVFCRRTVEALVNIWLVKHGIDVPQLPLKEKIQYAANNKVEIPNYLIKTPNSILNAFIHASPIYDIYKKGFVVPDILQTLHNTANNILGELYSLKSAQYGIHFNGFVPTIPSKVDRYWVDAYQYIWDQHAKLKNKCEQLEKQNKELLGSNGGLNENKPTNNVGKCNPKKSEMNTRSKNASSPRGNASGSQTRSNFSSQTVNIGKEKEIDGQTFTVYSKTNRYNSSTHKWVGIFWKNNEEIWGTGKTWDDIEDKDFRNKLLHDKNVVFYKVDKDGNPGGHRLYYDEEKERFFVNK